MKEARWQEISQLYFQALELPESERGIFLRTCKDEDLRQEVLSLLADETMARSFLERPALETMPRSGSKKESSLIGKQFGPYHILSELGRGGMGEVYRAHDGKLGRDVAIKTLPPEFAHDPDRIARFTREAKLLASLNHPNIAAIHGLEEADGTQFLILELVEGETLAEQLKRGPIPVEDSLKLALQIAEALEAAHEKGVIHRDLKPANIKVTPEGKVKVLDFGLAKAFAGEQAEMNLSNSPTLSDMATQRGIILGTAAYMSPEQAKGRVVDKRTDIWAFGCVLFEMLTGRVAIQGEDVSEILASVIKGDVKLDLLQANTHPRVREAIARCLQKDLKRRYQGIADATYEIEQALANPKSELTQPVATTPPRRRMLPWIAVTAILGVIIGGLVVWKFKAAEPREVMSSEYSLPEGQQFANFSNRMIAVSPDGKQYVYVTAEGLYLRSLEEINAKLLVNTGTSPACPFFSPDGKWIGYFSMADSKMKKIAVTGGTPVPLCAASSVLGGSWGTDDRIVYADLSKGITRVSANGGTPETIVNGEGAFDPQLLPDGKSVLLTSGPAPLKIVLQSLQSDERKELFEGQSARYISTGHIVYAIGSNLWAVPFDLKTLKVTDTATRVVEGVWRVSDPYPYQYAVSDSGTLVYMPATTADAGAQRTLVWVDRKGQAEPLAAPPDAYSNPRISPDGTRVALSVSVGQGGDIWTYDFHNTPVRLTFEKTNAFPLWTLDSKRIAFWSAREGTYNAYWKSADGTGKDELLGAKLGLRSFVPADWADKKTLVTTSWELSYMSGIGMLSMEGNRQFKFLLDEKYHEAQPRISPDGRYMAYASSESGREEIYVRSFPDMTGRWQISKGGGNNPLWSREQIFYRNGNEVIAIPVKTSPTFVFETPRTLFQGMYVRSVNIPGSIDFGTWDISPKDQRFLMLVGSSAGGSPRKIIVVTNWFEELKEKVPVD